MLAAQNIRRATGSKVIEAASYRPSTSTLDIQLPRGFLGPRTSSTSHLENRSSMLSSSCGPQLPSPRFL